MNAGMKKNVFKT